VVLKSPRSGSIIEVQVTELCLSFIHFILLFSLATSYIPIYKDPGPCGSIVLERSTVLDLSAILHASRSLFLSGISETLF